MALSALTSTQVLDIIRKSAQARDSSSLCGLVWSGVVWGSLVLVGNMLDNQILTSGGSYYAGYYGGHYCSILVHRPTHLDHLVPTTKSPTHSLLVHNKCKIEILRSTHTTGFI